MDLPRLILATEHRPGRFSPAVLVAAALIQRGYNLRLFVAGRDEEALSALTVLCGRPVAYLDPWSSGSPAALRACFQAGAAPGALNLVVGRLGERKEPDAPFRMDGEAAAVAEALSAPLVPLIYADASSAITGRTVRAVADALRGRALPPVRAALFVSALNPREYQLLDLEVGRRLPWLTTGYLPRILERESVPLVELCGEEQPPRRILPIRAAAAQLQGLEEHVFWPLFGALARDVPDWAPEPLPVPPIPSRPQVAVLRHPAFIPSGAGNEALLAALGAKILPIPLRGGRLPSDPDGICIPHGLGYLALIALFENGPLRNDLGRLLLSGRFFLAEGGGAPLTGETVTLPSRREVRGLSLFPFRGRYGEAVAAPSGVTAQWASENPLLAKGEVARGVLREEIDLGIPADRAIFSLSAPDGSGRGWDGSALRRGIATRLRLDLWSCPEPVRRMLLS